MKRAVSQDEKVQDWSGLLKAARESAAELEGVGPLITALEESRDQAVDLRSRRNALAASAHELTLQLEAAFNAGRDAAIRLRSYIRGKLGPRSGKLLRYGIKPLRKRPRTIHVNRGRGLTR